MTSNGQLGDLERKGLVAHGQKNRVAWPKEFERLSGIEDGIKKLKPPDRGPDISKLPTPLLKLIVLEQEINRRINLVGRHAQALMEQGEFEDWIGELAAIKESAGGGGQLRARGRRRHTLGAGGGQDPQDSGAGARSGRTYCGAGQGHSLMGPDQMR